MPLNTSGSWEVLWGTPPQVVRVCREPCSHARKRRREGKPLTSGRFPGRAGREVLPQTQETPTSPSKHMLLRMATGPHRARQGGSPAGEGRISFAAADWRFTPGGLRNASFDGAPRPPLAGMCQGTRFSREKTGVGSRYEVGPAERHESLTRGK